MYRRLTPTPSPCASPHSNARHHSFIHHSFIPTPTPALPGLPDGEGRSGSLRRWEGGALLPTVTCDYMLLHAITDGYMRPRTLCAGGRDIYGHIRLHRRSTASRSVTLQLHYGYRSTASRSATLRLHHGYKSTTSRSATLRLHYGYRSTASRSAPSSAKFHSSTTCRARRPVPPPSFDPLFDPPSPHDPSTTKRVHGGYTTVTLDPPLDPPRSPAADTPAASCDCPARPMRSYVQTPYDTTCGHSTGGRSTTREPTQTRLAPSRVAVRAVGVTTCYALSRAAFQATVQSAAVDARKQVAPA